MRLSPRQKLLQVSSQLLSDSLILGSNQSVVSHCMLGNNHAESAANSFAGGLCLGERRTAGPSTSLRSGRDDKGEGGGFY